MESVDDAGLINADLNNLTARKRGKIERQVEAAHLRAWLKEIDCSRLNQGLGTEDCFSPKRDNRASAFI